MKNNSDLSRTDISMPISQQNSLKSDESSIFTTSINEVINEDSRKKIQFSSAKFILFLYAKGVRKVKIGNEFELVLVDNYIVSKITPSEIKSIVLKEISTLENDRLTDYFLNKTTLFSMKFLDAVHTIELKMHRDNQSASFFYFKNGVVKVTAEGIHSPIPYHAFKRLIWKDHILNRNFNSNMNIEINPPIFESFLKKLSNYEEVRFLRMCTVIGFCLYDYKSSATSKAVIINDEILSSNPEGGSGKSLIVDALSRLRKTVFYDGKTFDPKATFAWQKIDSSVKIVSIDDVKRGFNFEELFSVITSGFRNINRKNKDEIELSVEDSPTIVITTNNILKGGSGSYTRRQYQVEIFQYFNRDKTPLDEYGAPFFGSWDKDEWNKFDAFMLTCVKLFLQKGVVNCPESDQRQKELIRVTNQTFAEWIDDNLEYMTALTGAGTVEMRDRFLHDTNFKSQISDRRFSDYIKEYCRLFGYEYQTLSNRRPRGYKLVKL